MRASPLAETNRVDQLWQHDPDGANASSFPESDNRSVRDRVRMDNRNDRIIEGDALH